MLGPFGFRRGPNTFAMTGELVAFAGSDGTSLHFTHFSEWLTDDVLSTYDQMATSSKVYLSTTRVTSMWNNTDPRNSNLRYLMSII